jgi:hypothetical protein
MEIESADSGPDLCFDILVLIFRALWADKHRAFIEKNKDIEYVHIVEHPYAPLSTVCKLWNSACLAAGLVGPRLDFPHYKDFSVGKYTIKIFNKVGMWTEQNHINKFVCVCLIMSLRGKTIYLGIGEDGLGKYSTRWDLQTKQGLTMSDFGRMCRHLADVFGDESPIANRIMHSDIMSGDEFHSLLSENLPDVYRN